MRKADAAAGRHQAHRKVVAHHVEKIAPTFRRVLLLKEGRMFDTEPTPANAADPMLSAISGCRTKCSEREERYRERVSADKVKVV